MEDAKLAITEVVRTKEGIIVTFSNGDVAAYDTVFLHRVRNEDSNVPLIEAGRWKPPQS